MNKRLFPLVLILICGTLLISCGRRIEKGGGATTDIYREVTAFSMIDISAPVEAKIQVKPGVTPSIKLSGYKNLVDKLQTRVEGNTLYINSKKHINFNTDKEVSVEITVPSLSRLGLHGAAEAHVNGEITGNDFMLRISGAGDAVVEKVMVNNLEASISGAGEVTIRDGRAERIEYRVSGAGDIKSFKVQAGDVIAHVSGAGDIEVNASRSLDAHVSGAGSIRYKGTPTVKSQTSGVGDVTHVD